MSLNWDSLLSVTVKAVGLGFGLRVVSTLYVAAWSQLRSMGWIKI